MVRLFSLLLSLSLFFGALVSAKDKPLSSKKNPSIEAQKPSEKYMTFLKVAGGIAIPMFVVGECMMYTQFVKATYQWITHGRQARSFFKKQPQGATYELTCTIKRFGSSYVKTFHCSNPKKLISDANHHITHYIKKEYATDLLVRIFLQPAIITKHGRRISLSPFYNLWNSEKGLLTELEKTFLTSPVSNADQVFKAAQLFTVGSLMTLTAPLLITAAYRLRGFIWSTQHPLVPIT